MLVSLVSGTEYLDLDQVEKGFYSTRQDYAHSQQEVTELTSYQPSRIIQERSKGERSRQSICPTNLPESFWLESIWLSNACAIRKDGVRMTSQRQPGN